MAGGGGSISTQTIPQPNWAQEQRRISQGYGNQTNQLGTFLGTQPLLQAAQTGALNAAGGLGGLTAPISALSGQVPSFFGGLQQNVSGLQDQLGGLIPEINRYQQQYTQQGQGLFNRLGGILSAPGGPSGIIASGGALTGDILRAANQQSLSSQEQAGVAHTSSGVAQGILNRDQARAGRLAQAQQVEQQVTQGQAGVTGLLGNLASQFTGQKAGIYGQQGSMDALRAGLFGQLGQLTTALPGAIQGLQTGAQNMLTGAEGANVGAFGAVTNPVLDYVSRFFGRQSAQEIAQAQINAQGQLANQSAGAGKSSGLLSAGGAIAGGALTAL